MDWPLKIVQEKWGNRQLCIRRGEQNLRILLHQCLLPIIEESEANVGAHASFLTLSQCSVSVRSLALYTTFREYQMLTDIAKDFFHQNGPGQEELACQSLFPKDHCNPTTSGCRYTNPSLASTMACCNAFQFFPLEYHIESIFYWTVSNPGKVLREYDHTRSERIWKNNEWVNAFT